MHLLQDYQRYAHESRFVTSTTDTYLITRYLGEIPSYKLVENDLVYSFLDIGPLSRGHALVIPKCAPTPPLSIHVQLNHQPPDHSEKMHELPDEYLSATLPVAKQIALAVGADNYNILQVRVHLYPPYPNPGFTVSQNNGRLAHQEVNHVHFHVIPKPSASEDEGLVIGWPTHKVSQDDLKQLHEELLSKL